MKELYYVAERITLDEPMDLHQAQDYAKTIARKHPSAQYHVLKSVGHTTQEVGWEWHNEQVNKDMIPADFHQGLDDLKHGRLHDMEKALNEPPRFPDGKTWVCSSCGDKTSDISPLGTADVIICEECANPRNPTHLARQYMQENNSYTPKTSDMDGYRMLQEGEIIQEGDEFLGYTNTWVCASRFGERVYGSQLGYYRRPISLDKTKKTPCQPDKA